MNKPSGCSLRIEILGPFRLIIYDQKIPIEAWKSRKALLLLKYLATRHGEKIPSDVLIDFLWPDSEFETSIHNLHTTIYFLRKLLKDHIPKHLLYSDWIHFNNGLYWLDSSDEVSVDVVDFLSLCRESEDLEKVDPLRSLEVGLQALGLYRGCFLPEDLYADWTETVRENCCAKYVELALRTCRLLVDYHGDYKTADSVCRAALGHAPYREELHQLQMRVLVAMGRLPEAVFQYHACAKVLHDELDLEPCPQTKALLKEIKANQGELICPHEINKEGGLICDRATFSSILTLEQRRLDRKQHPLLIITVSLDGAITNAQLHDIFSALSESTRKGDAVTHWSKQLFAILLSDTDDHGADAVQKRVRTKLGSLVSRCHFASHFLSPSDDLACTLADEYPEQTASSRPNRRG